MLSKVVVSHMYINIIFKFLDEYFDITKDMLDKISDLCVLCDDVSVPHECNQGIVFTSGMISSTRSP